MRQLLTILFCLFTLVGIAQKKYKGVVETTAEGYGYKSLTADSAFGLPRYNHKLDTSFIKYKGRNKDALMYYDTLHSYLFVYNPHTGLTDTINKASSSGGGTTIINNGTALQKRF
jgi:hypothetical protein